MIAYSPTGSLILGTLERLSGRAEISHDSFRKNADGTLDYEYQGGTELFYDDQYTVTKQVGFKDLTVFLDENGEEWTEDQLVLVDDEEGAT